MILHVEDSQSAVRLDDVKFASTVTLAIRAVGFPYGSISLMVSSLSIFKDGKDSRSSSGYAHSPYWAEISQALCMSTSPQKESLPSVCYVSPVGILAS